MTSVAAACMRELSANEIDAVAGGYFNGVTGTNIDAAFLPAGADFGVRSVSGGGVTLINAGDRNPRQDQINAQLRAAYAANPDIPRGQVYADFFLL
jgi:hypothetical protein